MNGRRIELDNKKQIRAGKPALKLLIENIKFSKMLISGGINEFL